MAHAGKFDKIALIGLGLIGSSLAHAIRRAGLADHIAGYARSEATRARVKKLGLTDSVHEDAAGAVRDADLVMICVPIGAYGEIAQAMAPALKAGAIVSDVGSVKTAAIEQIAPHLPSATHFIPGHPIAGTEHSGPDAGFAELFDERWTILTPLPDGDDAALARLKNFWKACGAQVDVMSAAHHDIVLAITSHIPHLIAYNIVGTAADLEADTQSEVIRYSASGFRDFTRIAASDPVMWRDIFLNNKTAVLEALGRFTEDLSALQRAIRRGDGDLLFELFTRTREIRRNVIEAGQDVTAADFDRAGRAPKVRAPKTPDKNNP